jgi:type I restriction enzyme S subunit
VSCERSEKQLPKNWVSTKLGDIAEIILGQSPPSSTYNELRKGLPFYQGKLEFGKTYPITQKWCTEPKKVAEKGDVLISVRAPVGPTNVCQERSCIGRGLAAVKGLGGIETFFILYLLRSYEKVLAGKGTGTTFSAISGGQLRGLGVPVPPLNEQHRIVGKVEELFSFLDAGVESLRKVQAQLKRYRQAVLKYAFEGKLTEEWRKNHKNLTDSSASYSEQTKEPSDLRGLPDGWKWITLQNIAKISGGLTKNPQRAKYLLKMPYLRVANVYAGKLLLDEIKYIGVKEEEVDKLLLNKGDLLIVEGNGSADQIGRVALWGNQISPCIHQNHIIKIRLEEIADSRYVLYWLLSPDGRAYIKSVASSTSGLYTLSISKVLRLPIPLASQAERHRILEEIEKRLSVLEHVEKYLPIASLLAERLRQSILKRAFEGRIIPQNPNDESAEVLLERIKAERITNGKPKTGSQVELCRYVK